MMKNTMKKLICCFLLLSTFCLSVFSLSSCDDSPVVPYRSWSERFAELEKDWNKAGSLVSSFGEQFDTSSAELTSYNYRIFEMYYTTRYIDAGLGVEYYRLQAFHSTFPIESIKLIDKNTICVRYKLELDDGTTSLAYVIFKREVKWLTKSDGVEKAGNYEAWKKNKEIYFVTEGLSEADFSGVKVGDSLLSVAEIAPSVKFDATHVTFRTINGPCIAPAYEILSDGILVLEFELREGATTSDLTAFTVAQKTFYPYSGTETPEYVSLTLKQLSALINN